MIKIFILISTFSYIALQIFIPKFLIFEIPIYIFTLSYILILILIFCHKGFIIKTSIEKSYYFFISFCLISTLMSSMIHNVFDIKTIFMLIKYILPLTIFPVVFYLKDYIKLNFLMMVFYSQIIFYYQLVVMFYITIF